ncbi:MAG: glycerol-3-phosphate 1-O-acyltransferase [Deltaproteobacteria bacterium]|nr:glycerol-3-phosphate 1-O-acyltransferase [Deltaproteobacteria bacterium]
MWPTKTPNLEGTTQWTEFDKLDHQCLFLLDASSPFEAHLLRLWIKNTTHKSQRSSGLVETVSIPSSRRVSKKAFISTRFQACLDKDEDPWVAPLRVAWLAKKRDGIRSARLIDLFMYMGDPRDPGRFQQRWTYYLHPDRCRILVGEPAPLSSLHKRWQDTCASVTHDDQDFSEFVARQAALTLEREERELRGARYKVPRFVAESISSTASFQERLTGFAQELELSEPAVQHTAKRYLREIAATHSTFVIDLVAQFIRLLYSRGYGKRLHYDQGKLLEIARLSESHPLVFLPSHKSNLDHLVLQYALYENGLPPTHTAGGININFFPAGPLLRRAGTFFIRRSFKDNELYKYVLKRYIDYLIEKRFSLEWYIEGSRSRSGKLLPPRFGLLSYVVDAFQRGKSSDVILVPVSIAYDQILEVGDYISEEVDGIKEKENLGWMVRKIKKLKEPRGNIHICFGEPLSLKNELASLDDLMEAPSTDHEHALQERTEEVAFQIGLGINRVTPITPTSLLSLAILCSGDRSLSVEEVQETLRDLLSYIQRRQLPSTGAIRLDSDAGVKLALDTLVRSNVLTCYSEGPLPVYAVGPDQELAAAYYRNTIIHFFVNTAIIELALLATAEEHSNKSTETFYQQAMQLRDLLKFDFYFEPKEKFLTQIKVELDLHAPEWREHFQDIPGKLVHRHPLRQLIRQISPLVSPYVLRSIFESYRVVGDVLEQLDPSKTVDSQELLSDCMALSKQLLLQRRIVNKESRSKTVFKTGIRLAKKRGLLDGDSDAEKLLEQRRAFAQEIRTIQQRINAISALTASRQAGFN